MEIRNYNRERTPTDLTYRATDQAIALTNAAKILGIAACAGIAAFFWNLSGNSGFGPHVGLVALTALLCLLSYAALASYEVIGVTFSLKEISRQLKRFGREKRDQYVSLDGKWKFRFDISSGSKGGASGQIYLIHNATAIELLSFGSYGNKARVRKQMIDFTDFLRKDLGMDITEVK